VFRLGWGTQVPPRNSPSQAKQLGLILVRDHSSGIKDPHRDIKWFVFAEGFLGCGWFKANAAFLGHQDVWAAYI
jgi:hypothetical protein